MGKFLNYSELDTEIQNRMAGQAPDSTKRLQAINDSINDLYTTYDIETGRRSAMFYGVPDGKPINLENLVGDFKKPADLRYLSPSHQDAEFQYRDDDEFEVNIGRGVSVDEYSVTYINGKLFLKFNTTNGVEKKDLHGMTSLTANGAWSADTTNSDATGLTTTDVTTLEQNDAIKFNIDVSQSDNNYALIENSTIMAVDLSDYESLGKFKFWIYLPSVTNFTSVELRWGSSSTAYWSLAATTQADGTALIAGWNFIEIDWADATETGIVDEENIDYLALKLNYAAGYTDQTNVVVEEIACYLPEPMKMVYYTYYVSTNKSYSFQEEMEETSGDLLLLPRRYKDLIVYKAMQYLAPMSLGDEAGKWINIWKGAERKQAAKLGLDIGNRLKTPVKKVKIHKPYG